MNSSVEVNFHKRSEVAFRSLDESEKNQILKIMDDLKASIVFLDKIKSKSGEELYIHKVNPELFLVFTYDGAHWILEDITNRNMIQKLFNSH